MDNINTMMFLTLSDLLSIETGRAGMWSKSDKYASPPFFRFSFKDEKLHEYEKLNQAIKKFKGSHSWILFNDNLNKKNFLILPEIFSETLKEDKLWFDKQKLFDHFGEHQYKRLVDTAIEDIPDLCNSLKRLLNVKN